MNHLTPHEIVEVAEAGAAADGRFAHLASCSECAGAVEHMRRTLGAVSEAGAVPEPSPLFWDHFAARVRAATEAEAVPRVQAWWHHAWKPALVAAAAVAVVLAGWQTMRAPGNGMAAGRMGEVPGVAAPAVAEVLEPAAQIPAAGGLPTSAGDGEDWIASAGLTEALAPESVASLAAPSADVFLAEELNDRELQEFARLLRAQMGGVE